MANNQDDNQVPSENSNPLYHFSKRILFLSLLFLLIFSAWYALIVFNQTAVDYKKVAPELIFASNQEVLLKTPFDKDFFSAKPNQALLAGTQIKTGDQSFAEIQLEGNVVRLDENTEIRLLENNFHHSDIPRLVFYLSSGSVWINAFDSIIIHTPKAQAQFAHSVGVYTYPDPLNRLMSIVGYIDLSLLDDDGDQLSEFIIPLKSQVTFANSQIIPEYSRLEYSKLRKELKMGPISKSILEDAWVKRNTEDDALMFLAENHYIFSAGDYKTKNFYHALREKLTLIPHRQRMERFNRAKIKLKYLLGGIHANDLAEEAEVLLGEFDELVEEFQGDPIMRDLIERQFYAIRNVRIDTPAYAVKENLRAHLFSNEKPEFLRTYLTDLDFLMRVGEFEQVEEASEAWLKYWKPNVRKTNSYEFNQQARIYHNILLANSDQVTVSLLAILDKVGDFRLELAENSEETLFEIALERLEMSKYLVAHYRYIDARNYLQTSYEGLNLTEKGTSAAAREIFLKDANLLADRIEFAQKILRGAARPIDQADFLTYLSTQERDRDLEERFIAFLKESEVHEEAAVYPKLDEVSQRFTLARIVVIDEDIETDPVFPFEFDVKNARLLDRAPDGSSITFSARYDYTTNAVYDITLNEAPVKGSYSLDDFVNIAKSGRVVAETPTTPEEAISNIVDFLNLTESEEAERSQIIAQDLAVQLVVNELEGYSIIVSNVRMVQVLDPVTLDEFKVIDAIIEDSEAGRIANVSFDYNSITKTLSNIKLLNLPIDLSSYRLQADEFILVIFKALYSQEEKAENITDTLSRFSRQDLLIEENDIIISADQNIVTFKDAMMKNMPIKFSGLYDRRSNIFLSAEHPLLTAQNVGIDEYLEDIAVLFVIDYLKNRGITVSEDNIVTVLPADNVAITDYIRGVKIFNFTLDLTTNRLRDISIQGTDAYVASMTFQEFSLVEGGEAPIEEEEEEVAEEEEGAEVPAEEEEEEEISSEEAEEVPPEEPEAP